MKLFFKIGLCCFTLIAFSQEQPNFKALDSLYREDQFYVGISYNTIQNRPTGLGQSKITPSFSFGFLRDLPINKSRTVAIAIGLGYSINNYSENLLITEDNNTRNYSLLGAASLYDKNKLYLDYVDLPIEFRWRNSTPDSHKFLRVYGGFKMSYLAFDRSKYVDFQSTVKVTSNPDFTKWQCGTYLSIGYNTWNLNVYYGLKPLLQSGTLNGKAFELKTINFGLMFYIL